jgi:hypothetical protein
MDVPGEMDVDAVVGQALPAGVTGGRMIRQEIFIGNDGKRRIMPIDKGPGEGIGLELLIEPGLVNLIPAGGIRLFEADDEDIIPGGALAHAHFVGKAVLGDLGQVTHIGHPKFGVIGPGSVDIAIGLMVAPDRVGDVHDGIHGGQPMVILIGQRGFRLIEAAMNLIARTENKGRALTGNLFGHSINNGLVNSIGAIVALIAQNRKGPRICFYCIGIDPPAQEDQE